MKTPAPITPERKPLLLLLIASMKFVKAAFLIITGIAALQLIDPEVGARLIHWTEEIQHHFSRDLLVKALNKILKLGPENLRLVAIGTFLYATLFIIEGVGLWMDKAWAEWLAVLSTAALIPLELYEIALEASLTKVAVLILNIFVVAYLIRRLRYKRRHRAAG